MKTCAGIFSLLGKIPRSQRTDEHFVLRNEVGVETWVWVQYKTGDERHAQSSLSREMLRLFVISK